jgi:beta-glucanase (GH16 family)
MAITQTTLVSVLPNGTGGNAESYSFSFGRTISTDGRYASFYSYATNLIPGASNVGPGFTDTNGTYDAFVKDVQTGNLLLVSQTAAGVQANGYSFDTTISADGRYAAFHSNATNLVSGASNVAPGAIDVNGTYGDIFVKDLQTGTLQLVSQTTAGQQADRDSYSPSISADGRHVAFMSYATNLVAGSSNVASGGNDTNGTTDVFVKDLTTGELKLVSQTGAGVLGNGYSDGPSISADGLHVVFRSIASNLLPGASNVATGATDTNGTSDIFVKDLQTNQLQLVTQTSYGVQANGYSEFASISSNGRYVAFSSQATNLVPGSNNVAPGATDANGTGYDVFLKDLQTGELKLVSQSASGQQGNSSSLLPSISDDGRYVAFLSGSGNLVANDPNGSAADIFVKDIQTGEVHLITYDTAGGAQNGYADWPQLSHDGRFVSFYSYSTDLVSGVNDTNGTYDAFVAPTGFAANQPPVNTVPSAQTVDEDAVLTFSTAQGNAVSVADADANPLTVTVSVSHGTLSLSGGTGLAFTAGDGTSDPSMTFSGTQANINAALNGLTYRGNANYNGSDTLTVQTSDGVVTDTDAVGITVSAVNDAPVLTPGNAVNYGEQASAVAIAPDIALDDVDSPNLVGARVRITDLVNGDALHFTNQNGITHTYDAATGLLTLTGSASVANYQTALRSITFDNLSNDDPTAGDTDLSRTITWQVDDGSGQTFADEFNSFQSRNGSSGWDWTGPQWFNFTSGTHSRTEPEGTYPFNNELQWYTNPQYADQPNAENLPNPFSVSNGVLSITARVQEPPFDSYWASSDYTSGLMTSFHQHPQLYGYFEISAKLPAGEGLLPAFWLLPADGTHAELDVMEIPGRTPAMLHTSVHSFASGNPDPDTTTNSTIIPDASAGFHTYGVDWQADTITWYFDGEAVFSTATPSDMHTPMYMIANLAVGGSPSFVGTPNASTEFPADYQIDYIRASTSHSRLSEVATTTINISAENDAPVNDVQSASFTTAEDTSLQITGLSVSDVDIGSGLIKVTLSVSHGTIAVDENVPGGLDSFDIFNNGTSSVTLECDPAFVNETLAHGIFYVPDANYIGSDTLTINTNDNGNTGSDPGGPDPLTEQDVDTIDITVTAVNDAPAIAVPGTLDIVTANVGSDDISILLAPLFATASALPIGGIPPVKPAAIAVGDLNADGRPDLVPANSSSGDVSVLLGDGRGAFTETVVPITSSGSPGGVALGDLDGDGKLDIVTANAGCGCGSGNDVSVLLGNGDGTFVAGGAFSVGGLNPGGIALADFNGDHILDAVTANFGSDDYSVLLGDGAGGFGLPLTLPGGFGPTAVAIADLNGDGNLDIVGTNFFTDDASLFLGDGLGGFSSEIILSIDTGFAPVSVAIGDLNGDGRLDIVTANNLSDDVTVLLGNGASGFTAQTWDVAGGYGPSSVALGDMDGDGDLDIVTTNIDSDEATVLFNDGTGTFASGILLSSLGGGEGPLGLALANLDNVQAVDEDTSLVFSAANNNLITVADVDANGGIESVTLSVQHGTLKLAAGSGVAVTAGANGSGSVTFSGTIAQLNAALDGLSYQGLLDYNGADALKLTIDDGGNSGGAALTASQLIPIEVTALNDAPVANADSYTQSFDGTLHIAASGVLANDTDVDSGALTAQLVGGAAHGALTFNSNGSFDYRPANTFFGLETFTYKSNDGALDSNLSTVTIDVTREISSETTINPGGGSTTTYYDAKGDKPWSSQSHNFDSNGHETSATVSYDDGSLQGATFDANNDQPWKSQSSVTNALGQVTNMGVIYDDGTQQIAIFDADNNQPWLSQNAVLDALGRQITLGVIYDDGSQQSAIFDAANNQLWSSQNMVYDVHGHLTNVGVIYDDLHTETAVYDVHSDQPWTSQSAVYDPGGNLIATSVSYDDGHVENWHI